jgi:hypothetical protein
MGNVDGQLRTSSRIGSSLRRFRPISLHPPGQPLNSRVGRDVKSRKELSQAIGDDRDAAQGTREESK